MYYVDDHPKRNSLFFTGKNYDKETGFYFFNARYYSPELGRFISRDPIGIADDIHLYAYVKNNPLKFTDPSGMEKKIVKKDVIQEIFMQILGIETVYTPDYNDLSTDTVEYTLLEEYVIFGASIIGPNKGGAIKNLGDKSIKEIKKSIKSLEKQIKEHKDKIFQLKLGKYKIDPSKIKGDINKYKEGLLKHWEKEVDSLQKNIQKEYDLLKNIIK